MATCPQCGVHGYPGDNSGFRVEETLVVVPGVLSGSQPKFPARMGIRLSHSCGWSVVGFVEGRHLVVPKSDESQEGGQS